METCEAGAFCDQLVGAASRIRELYEQLAAEVGLSDERLLAHRAGLALMDDAVSEVVGDLDALMGPCDLDF